MSRQVTCFHGTTIEASRLISINGFDGGSWFTPDLAVAATMGGPIVFAVKFDVEKFPPCETCAQPNWQFHHEEPIPASRIVTVWEVRKPLGWWS